jgi:hypothetical protein
MEIDVSSNYAGEQALYQLGLAIYMPARYVSSITPVSRHCTSLVRRTGGHGTLPT